MGRREKPARMREHRLEKDFQAANFPSRNTHRDDIQLIGGTERHPKGEYREDELSNFILCGKDQRAFETAGMQPGQQL